MTTDILNLWIDRKSYYIIRIPFPNRQEGKSSLLQYHTQSQPCSRTTKTKHESGQLLSLNACLLKNSIRKLQIWNMYKVRTLRVVNSILVKRRHKQILSDIIFAKLGLESPITLVSPPSQRRCNRKNEWVQYFLGQSGGGRQGSGTLQFRHFWSKKIHQIVLKESLIISFFPF